MKLTKQDITYLQEQLHEDDKSILQICQSTIRIERADDRDKKTKRITHEEARQLLGNEQFLGAIDRCVFHRTAAREIDASNKILFFENLSWGD